MIARGDIVTITGQPGQWAVFEPAGGIPPGRRWRCVRVAPSGLATSRNVGDGDVMVIASPAFEPGQKVKHWGQDAEVIEDKGDLVTIRQTKRKQVFPPHNLYPGGIFTTHTGDADVARGALVVENLTLLLKENDDD